MERYDKYEFDKMIYAVAIQQDLHLAQFFKIVEAIGHKDIAEKCEHISFGMMHEVMRSKSGQVQASREFRKDRRHTGNFSIHGSRHDWQVNKQLHL